MAVDAFEPDRPVGDNRVEIGRGREAAQSPFFLIPPAPDDPRQFGVFVGIFLDRRLRLGQRAGLRKVEQHQ
jgi:hypothetical protein